MNIKNDELLLIKRTLADKENFTHIVQKYENALFKYVKRISSFTDEQIEDLLQEVFISVYVNLRDFDEKMSSFSAWIYRIARNKTIDAYRKTRSRPHGHCVYFDERVLEILSSQEENLSEKADTKLAKEKLKKAIEKLKDIEKEVLELRFYEQKSYLEISDILQVPVGTVSTLIARAKKKLQKELENYKF